MSSIKLSPSATGTGIFTVAAPATNTDRTLTLPDSTGTIATAESTLSQFNASGSAPVYACRAWVNFNGTGTVAIRGSGNVSSITDSGVGTYYVNYTVNMPDTNYAPVVSSSKNGGGASSSNSAWLSTGEVKAINSCLIEVFNLSSSYIDVGNIQFAVLR